MQRGPFVLGRYHCRERLGSSPLGAVWAARIYGPAGFEKEFAVTLLDGALVENDSQLGELVHAATLAVELHAERLAKIHEIDAAGGHPFLVSERVHGIDLGRLLALEEAVGRRLPLDGALALCIDAAETLLYAHGRYDLGGVVHGALSPASVMLDLDGEVRLLDLGVLAPLVKPGWTLGRALKRYRACLAPEVLSGGPARPSSDVFSLGAILGRLVGSEAPAPLRALVRRATDPDPNLRHPTMVMLRDALAPMCNDRLRARAELAVIVRRHRAAQLAVAGGAVPSRIVRDSSSGVRLHGGVPQVAPQLPAPPTLSLEALRPPRRWPLVLAFVASALAAGSLASWLLR